MFTRNDERIISKYLKRNNLEQSDFCNECLEEFDISELNIPKGKCFKCAPAKKLKITKELLEKIK